MYVKVNKLHDEKVIKMEFYPAYRLKNGKESIFTDKCEDKIDAVELAKTIQRCADPEADIGYAYFNNNSEMVFVIHSESDAKEADKRGRKKWHETGSKYQSLPIEGLRTDKYAPAIDMDDHYRMYGEKAFGPKNNDPF